MITGGNADRHNQMIPSDIKFDGNATPPQFTDNADQVIERGTHIRVKIKGIRGEVGQMYAIATIKEDFLGYVDLDLLCVLMWQSLTLFADPFSRLESCCNRKMHQSATNHYETAKTKQPAMQGDRQSAHKTRIPRIYLSSEPSTKGMRDNLISRLYHSIVWWAGQRKKAQIDGRREERSKKRL